jgi:hypothetical protein
MIAVHCAHIGVTIHRDAGHAVPGIVRSPL